MTEQSVAPLSQKQETPVFRGSLVRTVIISLIFIALLPATLIGAISYIRFRSSLQTQTISQLSSIAQTNAIQLEQLNSITQSAMIGFANSSNISYAFLTGSGIPGYFSTDAPLNNYIQSTIAGLAANDVYAIYAVDSAGKVLISSKTNQIGTVLTDNPAILELFGKSTATMVINPDDLHPNQLVLVSAYTKTMQGQPKPVTFLFYSRPAIFTTLLKSPLSYFSSANVFFITGDKQIISLNPVMGVPEITQVSTDLQSKLAGYAAQAGDGKDFSYTNINGTVVYSYIRPITAVSSNYVIEVPLQVVQSQLQTLLRLMLILLAATLLVSGVVAFIGARQIALPLVELSDKARKFAGGDFSQKASINRRDEIGLLASSFNYMVSQLSTLYTSLEARVADRTTQLRTTSEIALDAVSAPTTNEILKRVTQSIVDKLGFSYASIYLVDKNKQFLLLTEDFSNSSNQLPDRSLRLPLDGTSLIGWSASNVQARISQNVLTERPKLLTTPYLSSTQSEIAIPITIGDRLIGILDIQSESLNAFDFDSMPAFSTLTNQIATGLRNIELLESTQFSLQETAGLYSSTRVITQAQNDEEVLKEINRLFTQSSYVSLSFDVIEGNIHLVDLADANITPSDKSLLGTVIPFTNALRNLSENGMVIVNEFQYLTDFSGLTAYFGRRGCHSAAVIPVFEGKDLKHVLAIGSREETPLTSLQLQPYVNLAEAIGTSLEKIHLSNSLTQKEKEITMLSNIHLDADEETNLQNVFGEIHQQIRNTYGQNIGLCIALLAEDPKRITIPYYCAEEIIRIQSYLPGSDLLSTVLNSGEILQIEDLSNTNQLMIDSPGQQLRARSYIGIPMTIGNNIIGVVAIFTTDNIAVFDQKTRVVFELLSSRLALSFFIQQQHQNLIEIQRTYEFEKYLLDSLLENIPDRISIKNTNNEFIRLSNSLSVFLGKEQPKDLIGKLDEYHYLPEEEGNENAAIDEIISTQTPLLNHTEKWVDREGNPQWVISNRIPLVTPEGSVTGLLSISNNVTDLIKVQKLAEHRAEQLLTASEIASESTAGTMDVNVTLARLVNLIKERFDFYQASIFLVDPLGKFAILRESTGEAGAEMKQKGHKLAVGSTSIVGQATGKGIPVVVGDVTQEANYFANPLLPDTRSELAIPMKIGERVLGALDVQSTVNDAFSQEDINILQILANQTAVAVQNADLFTHTNQSLSRHRMLHQITESNVETLSVEDAIRATLEVLHQAMPNEQIVYFSHDLKDTLTARASAGITNPDQTSRIIPIGRGVVGRVASENQPIKVDDAQSNPAYQPQNFETNSILAVPVRFADTLLGVINIESTALAQFDENDLEFVTTLAGNMGSIISNIKLIEQVHDQVNRQQKLFEITSKIRRSVDLDTIIQTSISEIGSALNVRRATIKISPKFEDETKKEQGQ
ncbi:MAG: GAF domain-containing protein [Anaerolineaceae bacterium]